MVNPETPPSKGNRSVIQTTDPKTGITIITTTDLKTGITTTKQTNPTTGSVSIRRTDPNTGVSTIRITSSKQKGFTFIESEDSKTGINKLIVKNNGKTAISTTNTTTGITTTKQTNPTTGKTIITTTYASGQPTQQPATSTPAGSSGTISGAPVTGLKKK
jgi:hypothetical protein